MYKMQPCPICEDDLLMEFVNSSKTVTIKGKRVSFEAEYFKCTVCGTEVEEPGQLDRNLDAAREAYDRIYVTPSREALVALREKYRASQKAFSALLGFGEATMNVYEQGGVPDSANRLLLLLAQKPAVFKEMYNINKDKIGMIQRKRIEASPGYKEACDWVTVPCSAIRASFALAPGSWTQSSEEDLRKPEESPHPNKDLEAA